MNKELSSVVTEYASQLIDEELHWLYARFDERISGDLAEAINFISKNRKIDLLLATADSANSLFDMCDDIRDSLREVLKRRTIVA